MTDPNKYPEHTVRRALTEQRFPSDNGRFQRHSGAVSEHSTQREEYGTKSRSFEAGLCHMLTGLAQYAGAHVRQYGSPIAEDGVLGVAWRESLAGLRQLLNGELGRLDGGTLDHAIIELYKAAGFEGDEP
jgi:hypothetical protein